MTVKARESGAQSRALLRRLRLELARSSPPEAGDGSAQDRSGQERLNRIVALVATGMVAEVCSIYLIRDSDVLELAATEGLNQSLVGKAKLRVGQGLVGRIAKTGEPVNTDDAVNEPGFLLIPGIGEEEFRSFLGAPIMRHGHMLGVLVVQNRAPRRYDEDELDALELIAMVIAEMTEAGALVDPNKQGLSAARDTWPRSLPGGAACEGVAMGEVVLHEPKIVLANPIAEDVESERQRLHAAMDALRGEVDDLIASNGGAGDAHPQGEHREVLEAFRMFAHDSGWLRRLEDAVVSGLAAEAAVEKVQSEARIRLDRTADPYLRERLSDIDDLANRLIRKLLGVDPPAPEDLPEGAILLARTLGPGEMLDYGRSVSAGKLKAVALEEGSAAGHAAIVARAFDIPLVTSVKGLIGSAENGDEVIVDGDVGRVLLRPDASVASAYREKLTLQEQAKERFLAVRDKPAVSLDGRLITLLMNAGLLTDLPSLEVSGAEGVGLYRTELQYLINSRAPRRDRQTQVYQRVLERAGDLPVTFRTLDMGGDKQLPFLKGEAEENPALGWRAIRIALDRPLLFRMQLQALVRAAAGRQLSVMFPMIADPIEFREARALLDAEIERAGKEGRELPTSVKIGAMVETPALGFASDCFFKRVDFLSVGGNDLMQFFFAADRGNERVRKRYDALNPSFLRFLRHLARRCEDNGTQLSFCGEMAGKPLEAIALAALGFQSLSMRPAAIGPVKLALRSVDLDKLADVLNACLDAPDTKGLPCGPRETLTSFARNHQVEL
ncbi:MAG: phosphoenolpyruvate--protein phosphotransferase [Pseudomonadota bacterium]